MSAEARVERISVPDLAARKGGEPIVYLTAYTTPVARQLDPHVDVLLVGDSLGMVLYGLESTIKVTLEMMIAHGAAVARGSKRACLVVDLPFIAYKESPQIAFRSAAKVMAETGCSAVKLEGGVEMAETVDYLVRRGIPVVGHVGLTPQSVHRLGGYRARGRQQEEAAAIIADAEAIAASGAFNIVLEGVLEPLAREIVKRVSTPIIGIGASAACDGQVLVTEDITGLFADFKPKFVKRYAQLGPEIGKAAAAYAAEVRQRSFPGPEHVFGATPKK